MVQTHAQGVAGGLAEMDLKRRPCSMQTRCRRFSSVSRAMRPRRVASSFRLRYAPSAVADMRWARRSYIRGFLAGLLCWNLI